MNINNLRKTLESMKGKTFDYSNKTYTVKDFVINSQKDRVSITTDKRTFEKDLESAPVFLSYWQEVEAEPVDIAPETSEKVGGIVAFKAPELTLVDELTAILRDNIAKVQDNKEYIPQATAINNNVNSIINLTKLKLDVYKQFKARS